MPKQNPYEQYQRNKVLTASPAEITLMLYEGAIKFCNIAIMAIEQNDMEKAHTNIRKTQRIIEEFRNTLTASIPWRKILTECMCMCFEDCLRQTYRKTRRFWKK